MSEKKGQKSMEELCRLSSLAAAREMSNHRLLRSPSPRDSFSRGTRRLDTSRRSHFQHNDFISARQSFSRETEKRMYQASQEPVKKTFFPGIQLTQTLTHADPPFAATDTQPLPPIKMPKPEQDNRPLVSLPNGKPIHLSDVVCDMKFCDDGEELEKKEQALLSERKGKRKLEALKPSEKKLKELARERSKKKYVSERNKRAKTFVKMLDLKQSARQNDPDSDEY